MNSGEKTENVTKIQTKETFIHYIFMRKYKLSFRESKYSCIFKLDMK